MSVVQFLPWAPLFRSLSTIKRVSLFRVLRPPGWVTWVRCRALLGLEAGRVDKFRCRHALSAPDTRRNPINTGNPAVRRGRPVGCDKATAISSKPRSGANRSRVRDGAVDLRRQFRRAPDYRAIRRAGVLLPAPGRGRQSSSRTATPPRRSARTMPARRDRRQSCRSAAWPIRRSSARKSRRDCRAS